MAFIVEDGTAVFGANAYVTVEYVNAYLTDRNRASENSWNSSSSSVRQSAIIAATDYVEQVWSDRFLGEKEYKDVSQARGTLTLTQLPTDGQQVVVGSQTYTFRNSLSVSGEVLIGSSVAETIGNLVSAINTVPTDEGIKWGTGTPDNTDATADEGIGNTMIVQAESLGTAGNDVVTTTTVSGATFTSGTLQGGSDYARPQPLSFPRRYVFDRSGVELRGIPDLLKYAVSEYSVRAVAQTLLPDPSTDATGRLVTRFLQKVGPITEETRYGSDGVVAAIVKPYPAGDRFLRQLAATPGNVIR